MGNFSTGQPIGVSFIVKNTTIAPGRTIKVFNTKINPGLTLDVMKVPGIGENDVREALLKGDLGLKIRDGQLTVLSSTLVIPDSDPEFVAFLNASGLTTNIVNNNTGTGGGGGGGGSSMAGSNIFTYRDSEPSPSGNIFSTFASAYAAAAATGVPATIVIDDSLNTCSIPANSTNYDMSLITLAGNPNGNQSVLTIYDGITWTINEQITIKDKVILLLEFSSPTASLCTPHNDIDVFLENQSILAVDNNGRFFDGSINDTDIIIHLGYACFIAGNGSNGQVVWADENGGGASFIIDGVNSNINNDAAGSTGGSSGGSLDIYVNNLSATYPTNWPFFDGRTPNYHYSLLASNLQPYAVSPAPTFGPTNPNVTTGTMYFDTNLRNPFWWDGSTWVSAGAYKPEFTNITLSSPQTTNLATGKAVALNNVLSTSATNTHLGYSSSGRFFMSFYNPPSGAVSAKLVGNIGSLFDGSITYQWVDTSLFTGSGAILSSFSSPNVTITGLSGIPETVNGQQITIANAINSSNNGTFTITSYNSPTSVTYNNPSAVVPDDGGGNLSYSIQCNIPVGNVSGNVGGGNPGDIVAFIPASYAGGVECSFFFEFQLTFVSGTTFIGENTAGGFIFPWATIETVGSPQ